MKYVKSIRWKRTHEENKDDKPSPSPCIDCDKECKGVDCGDLEDWLRGKDEVFVEWDVCNGKLVIARMICKTFVWVIFFILLGFIAWKWNGIIGGNATSTNSGTKCFCKEAGK